MRRRKASAVYGAPFPSRGRLKILLAPSDEGAVEHMRDWGREFYLIRDEVTPYLFTFHYYFFIHSCGVLTMHFWQNFSAEITKLKKIEEISFIIWYNVWVGIVSWKISHIYPVFLWHFPHKIPFLNFSSNKYDFIFIFYWFYDDFVI